MFVDSAPVPIGSKPEFISALTIRRQEPADGLRDDDAQFLFLSVERGPTRKLKGFEAAAAAHLLAKAARQHKKISTALVTGEINKVNISPGIVPCTFAGSTPVTVRS